VAVGAEEAFGVGGEGYVLGEPENGEGDFLDAAAVGGYLIEAIIDDDAIAVAVDGEVVWQGHALCIYELIEEASASVFVYVEVLYGMGNGFAEEVGVGDEVGEVDGVAGFNVDGEEVCSVYTKRLA
jgi:hypothetical protein